MSTEEQMQELKNALDRIQNAVDDLERRRWARKAVALILALGAAVIPWMPPLPGLLNWSGDQAYFDAHIETLSGDDLTGWATDCLAAIAEHE